MGTSEVEKAVIQIGAVSAESPFPLVDLANNQITCDGIKQNAIYSSLALHLATLPHKKGGTFPKQSNVPMIFQKYYTQTIFNTYNIFQLVPPDSATDYNSLKTNMLKTD